MKRQFIIRTAGQKTYLLLQEQATFAQERWYLVYHDKRFPVVGIQDGTSFARLPDVRTDIRLIQGKSLIYAETENGQSVGSTTKVVICAEIDDPYHPEIAHREVPSLKPAFASARP